MPDTNSAESAAYEIAVRAIQYQTGLVDNLRARVGTLLSASAVVTSFLGAVALDERHVRWWAAGPAIGCFALAACLCLLTLQTRTFDFAIEPLTVLRKTRDDTAEQRAGWLAAHVSWQYERNKVVIEGTRVDRVPPGEIAQDQDDDGVVMAEIVAGWRNRYGIVHIFRTASALLVVEVILWLVALW